MKRAEPTPDFQRADVIVAGGGFAGLALALALDCEVPGIRIAIIERKAAATPGPDSRASAVSAGSRRLLAALGIWSDIEPHAEPVKRIELTDTSLEAGIRPVLLTYDNHVEGHEPATHIVPNGKMLEALLAAARTKPGIAWIDGSAVRHAGSGPDAEVALASGVTVRAQLAVAADGRRSALREAAGIKTVGWSYPQTGIVVTVAHDLPHNGVAVQHFLPAGPFAILPLPGHRSCVTWTEDAAEARRILDLDDAGFLDQLDRRFGGKLGALRLAGPRQSWPLEMHLARTYVAPRLALMGDAAHGVHPIAGQGLNLALRDAAALAELVADAAGLGLDIGSDEILAAYERRRRFDSGVSAFAYDSLNRLFSTDNVLVRAVRDTGLGAVDRMPWLKDLLVREAAGVSGELPRLMRE